MDCSPTPSPPSDAGPRPDAPSGGHQAVSADYVVVGSGLTGATVARLLADAGRDVIVLERRGHVGGNVHDYTHPSGVRIHTYGPHYFRTCSEAIWEYVNRFADFHRYEAVVKTSVDGRDENWPVSAEYIRREVGPSWEPGCSRPPTNFEEASLGMMPEPVYRKFIAGYTEKQWGVPPADLDADLARRFEVREDGDPRLVRHKYQGIPRRGYAAFSRNMLAGVPVVHGYDYLANRHRVRARKVLVFTGPIDEYYGHELGRLGYRAQRREHQYLPGEGLVLPCGQVNNPDPANGRHIRTLEWKHMMPPEETPSVKGTVITREYPYTPDEPGDREYPLPDQASRRLYKSYRARARATPGLLVCGRLGEFRYFDMDQAIARAMTLARGLLSEGAVAASHE